MNWLRKLLQAIGIGRPNTIKADDFPAEIENRCHKARGNAIVWYTKKPGSEWPKIKPVRVIIESSPRNGMAGWTVAISGGYEIHLAREYIGQAIDHEFRHTMPGCYSCLLYTSDAADE